MKKALIGALTVAFAGVVLGATVFRAPLAQAAAPIQSIFVANDAAHSMPIREQNLDASGNLKVHEQGTSSVRDVTATSAVQAASEFTILTSLHQGFTSLYTVPDGKKLVIEEVDAQYDDSDSGVDASIYVQTNLGVVGRHWLPLTQDPTSSTTTLVGGGRCGFTQDPARPFSRLPAAPGRRRSTPTSRSHSRDI